MNIGKFIQYCVGEYLDKPIILLPFVIIGLITTGLKLFSQYYLHTGMEIMSAEGIREIISSGEIPLYVVDVLLNYAIILLVSLLFLSFISSFFHAFSIGLASKIAVKKRPTLTDGFKTLHAGFRVFTFKMLIWLFTGLGAVFLFVSAGFLFGYLGIFAAFVCTVFYTLLLQFVGFFGKQAIVLENLRAWAALQRSYKVIIKNLDNILLLMGAYLFIMAAFIVFKKVFTTISNYLVSGFGLVVFAHAADFVFTFLILSPIFIIIKTTYFIQQAPKQKKARAA